MLSYADKLTLSLATMQPQWLVDSVMSSAKFAHEMRELDGSRRLINSAKRACVRRANELISVLEMLERA